MGLEEDNVFLAEHKRGSVRLGRTISAERLADPGQVGTVTNQNQISDWRDLI
jgi:hypothetical protein